MSDMIDLRQGNCLAVMSSMPKNSVDLVLTDPPYKTTSRGSSGGTGGMLKSDINKSGMVFKHNTIKFDDWLPECFRVLKDGGHAYFMTNNKNLLPMLKAVELAGFNIFKTLIWAKNTAITNMYYMDSHEYIIFCRKGKAKKINNCGTKSVMFFDNPKNKVHPTEKPVGLMTQLIENSTNDSDVVLDLFMGSGSTGVACVNTNRKFIGIELDEDYFGIAQERINPPTIDFELEQLDIFGEQV